jgi:hypothetical protein
MVAGKVERALRLITDFADYVFFTETWSITASRKLYKKGEGLLTRCCEQDRRSPAQKGPQVGCHRTEA